VSKKGVGLLLQKYMETSTELSKLEYERRVRTAKEKGSVVPDKPSFFGHIKNLSFHPVQVNNVTWKLLLVLRHMVVAGYRLYFDTTGDIATLLTALVTLP
jgi:hypothetical protein